MMKDESFFEAYEREQQEWLDNNGIVPSNYRLFEFKIKRIAESYEGGWDNTWTNEMVWAYEREIILKMIDIEASACGLYMHARDVKVDNYLYQFRYPFYVLDIVTTPVPKIREDIFEL